MFFPSFFGFSTAVVIEPFIVVQVGDMVTFNRHIIITVGDSVITWT